MALKNVSTSLEPAVTLDEAKAHLRVEHTDDDLLITSLVTATTQYAEKFLGRAVVDQTWDLYLDAFPTGQIEIPKPPLIEVLGVFYEDANGDEQEFTSFAVDVASDPGRVSLLTGGAWPTPATVNNAVRIRFRAGYMDTSVSPAVSNIPEIIRRAILLYVGSLYEHRETVIVGTAAAPMPWSAEQLLRIVRFDLSMA